MSGTARVKPPKNDQEWARNVEKRQRQLEHPTSQRVGDWVLSTHPDTGDLIASNVNGGSIILAAKPEASADADAVITQGAPFIRLERQINQQGSRGSTALVLWDTVSYQTDEWGFVPTASDVVVPEDGVYLCIYHLAFLNASDAVNKGLVLVDSEVKMAQEFNTDSENAFYHSMYMAEPFPLNSGQLISCGAYVSGSGTFDFGASGADPSVYTSLSLLKLPVD